MIHIANIRDVVRGDATVTGTGVLIDRLWPRGLSKEQVPYIWLKGVAPSTELRKWFAHDPEKWEEFQERYRAELAEGHEDLDRLLELGTDLTLLYGARDHEYNQAVVLAEWLTEHHKKG